MPHIASTLSTDMKYTLWKSNPGGINNELAHVVIHGGHGVAHRRKHGGLETPNGVITSITEDELELLKKDEAFQVHLKNGFVKIIETKKAPEPEKAAADLNKSAADQPLVDKDFVEGGRAGAPKGINVKTGKGK